MPNHIVNIVNFSGDPDEIKKLKAFVRSPAGTPEDEMRIFDFEQIIPPPANMIREDIVSGKKYDGPTWYDWQREHWGTKWNCYEVSAYDGGFRFQTAWSTPSPIWVALAEKFPHITFEIRFADEDIGHNLGHFSMCGRDEDVKQIADFEPGSDLAVKFACELHGYDYDEYTED